GRRQEIFGRNERQGSLRIGRGELHARRLGHSSARRRRLLLLSASPASAPVGPGAFEGGDKRRTYENDVVLDGQGSHGSQEQEERDADSAQVQKQRSQACAHSPRPELLPRQRELLRIGKDTGNEQRPAGAGPKVRKQFLQAYALGTLG